MNPRRNNSKKPRQGKSGRPEERGMTFGKMLLIATFLLGTALGTGIFLKQAWAGPAVSVQVQVPGTNSESVATLKMIQPRFGHQATTLADGRILITGGYTGSDPNDPNTLIPATLNEVFDPATGVFSEYTGELPAPENLGPVAPESNVISVSNGGNLVLGLDSVPFSWEDIGSFQFQETPTDGSPAITTEIPVPADTNLFTLRRAYATATPLHQVSIYETGDAQINSYNRVLVVGGLNLEGEPQDSAIFNPARLATDKDDYVPGEVVWLSGSGWKASEDVDIYVVDNKGWHYETTLTADESGKFPFEHPLFDVIQEHLGVTFDLTAIGIESGLVSAVRFKDSSNTDTVLARTIGSSPSTYGTPITFTATVTLHSGGTVTTGTVDFKEGTTVLVSGVVPNASGQASATISTLSVSGSPHTITAKYNGTGGGSGTGDSSDTILQAITARAITVTAAANSKTYDGTTSATATPTITLGTLASGDTATLTETYNTKNAGTSKTLVPTATIKNSSNVDVTANYNITPVNNTTGIINARPLTVTAATNSKTYDSTTSAATAPTISSGTVQPGDSANFTETYDTRNVGSGKTLTPAGTVTDGNSGNNYTYSFVTANTGTITARALTVTAATNTKTYDGTTSAAATPTITVGALQGSDTAVFTETYNNKNVGTSKTLTPTGTITDGNAGNNYTVTFANNLTGVITGRSLTVTATGVNKTYDSTTAATVTLSDNRLSGDVFTDSFTTATFANKNVGTAKTVSVSGISISGTDAGNYTVNTTASTTADITARSLTVSATGVNKAYDGGTTATVTLSDNRVGGDVLTDSSTSATFADKNVGTAKTVSVSGISISGTDSGNYSLANTTAATTANITARALTVTATGVNKTYDGTTAATVTLFDNRVAGDVFTDSNTTATFATKAVANGKTVSVSGISISGTDSGNYSLANTTATTTANITARALNVNATGVNKIYNGNTTATVTLSDDRVSGDVFTDSFTTATFADKNVGTAKTVSVSGISISGIDAANYTFNTTDSTTADITARSLTVSATGVNKVYDGLTIASVTLSDNRVGGDVFTDSSTGASFADKNVANGKTVSVSGISISGTDSGNYSLANTTATTTANITARALTVTATGANKVYDGTTTATVTLSDNRVAGDVFTDSNTTATFATKTVANGKTVSVSGISISGTDAGNYTFNATASTTANITARALNVNATGVNKVYNGNTTATVTLSDDRISGDVFTDSFTTATFANKNVGTAKTVSVSGISISGTDAANYSFNITDSTTADITARSLTVSATGVNRVYDGTTAATVTLSDNRVGGDIVTDSFTSATFADKNVGTAKTVSVSGISISGTDSGNYSLANTTAATTANITARALTVTATGVNKAYDGTTAATVTLSDNRILGDVFTDSNTTATFATKTVGTAKTVSVSGISISGTDAANYTVNTTTSTTANITARALNVNATGVNKVYNGNTTATVTLSDDRVSGDVFTDSFSTATFADKNVGTAKTVSVSGISITGTDAGNYTANTTDSTTADITARSLTVSATGVNRVYDGTTAATVTLSDNRVGGDVVTDSFTTATFVTKTVANGKTVNVSGISISGTDSGNYSLTSTTASTTANITARALTVSATGVNKVYDGSTTATVTLSDDRVSGDVFTDSFTTANFATKKVGTGKTVSVSGISISGTDAGNYTVNTTALTTADITARSLTVSATGVNKVYDGTATASVTLSDNRIGGDVVTDNFTTATFANENVGPGKTVNVSGISISGTDAGNYSLANTTASTTANITVRAITVTAVTDMNKIYDGTSSSSVLPAITSGTLAIGDTAGFIQTFDDKTVGNHILTPSGLVIDGNSGNNYAVNFVSLSPGKGKISARALTVSATASNKVYDGNTTAAVTLSDDRVSGDIFTVTFTSATFANKNVGTGKTVTVSGISISGTDAGNYTFNATATTTADITVRPITVTADAKAKAYGAADPALTYQITLGNLVNGDGFSGALSRVAGENIGAYAIVQNSLALSANYALTYAGANLTITTRPVTVTADAQSKVYGEADPALTYQIISGTLAFTDAFTGSLTRAPGENVGPYAIQQHTLALSANYALTYIGANLTITKATLTVTADDKSKTYGDANPAFTASYSGFENGDILGTSDVTGSPSLTTTADGTTGVGSYTITAAQSTLASANYTFAFVDGSLAITERPVTVTADAQSKVYGTSDPALTYQITSGNLVNGDMFSGALARVAGQDVGAYAITQNTLALSANYALTYIGANLGITVRPVTVTADATSKVYGDADPALTYQITSGALAYSDSFSGALSRVAGENVGNYAITQNTLALSANYALTYVGADLTITVATLTVTADDQSKIYGNANPTFTASYSGFVNGDTLGTSDVHGSPSLTTTADGTTGVGSYTITAAQSTLASANYTFAFVDGSLAITERPVMVTADAQSKVYGTSDPALTYQITSGNLVNGDMFSGALARVAGQDVGAYAITQNTLALSANYALTYIGANLSITVRPVTVTADAKSKVYGDGDPALTYQITSGALAYSDSFSGGLSRVAGENVGNYAITQNTLALSANYALTYVGANLTITVATLTVTADDQSKIYGNANPTFTASYSGFVNGDTLGTSDVHGSPSLTTTADGTTGVGSYTITAAQGTLASANYTFAFVDGSLAITERPVTVTADAQSKVYGTSDPALTYQITSGNLVNGDMFSGALARVAGQDVGAYAITQNTLALSANYALTYIGANLGITVRPVTVTADATSKVYGDADPALTYQITSGALAYSDSFSGALSRVAGENVGSYAIQQNTLSLSANYALAYIGANLTITKATLTAKIIENPTKVYDGNDQATLVETNFKITGLQPNESVTVTQTVGTYNEKDVATATNVTATLLVGDFTSGPDTDLNNYTLPTTAEGPGAITKAPLTVTADDKAKTYGGADPTLTYTPSGTLYYSDGYGVISGVTLSTTTGAAATYGTHPITPSGGTAANYAISYVNGTLTVSKAPLTVTADDKSKVYGGVDPTLTYTPSGTLYYGNTYAVITGVTLSTTTGAAATYGTHPITPSGGTAANYAISYVNGTLTVSKAPLTVTADDKSKVYGGVDPTLTYTPSGTLYYGNTYAVITGVTLSTTTGAAATYGTHPITPSGGTAANYAISYVDGTLTVSKASLTVTADDKAKTYGGVDPTLTYTPSGTLYYSDGYGVISGVTLSTTTGAAATYGTHPITPSGGTAANYAISYVNGTLTVSKAPLTVTADDKSKVYGGVDPTLTYTPSGALYYGDGNGVISGVTLSTTTGAAATYGTHPITPSGGTAANYAISYVNGTLTVSKAPLTVTADDKAKVYGGVDPTLTYTPSGTLYYGNTYAVITGITLSTTTGAAATYGTHPITPSGGTAANYAISYVNGTLTVSKAPLTITAANRTKAFGLTATFATAAPSTDFSVSGLLYGDTVTSVTLSSAGAPAAATVTAPGPTYSIVPSSATGTGLGNYTIGYANGTLTITLASTTGAVVATPGTQQYSDMVTFTATLSPDQLGGVPPATGVTFKVGTQVMGSATLTPSGGSLSASITVPLLETVIGQMAPGMRTVTATFTGVNSNFTVNNATTGLTITTEDAVSTYTGSLFVSTGTGTTATITLSATVQDISAATSDPATDAYPGDIRKATVTFYIDGVAQTPLNVGLVSSTDTTVGTVTMTKTGFALGEHDIKMVIGGYYKNAPDIDGCEVVSVEQTGLGKITGGGYLIATSASSGTKPAGVGTRNNFGFNVQNTKSGVKGTINTILRNGGRVYQIKGNAMTSLTTQPVSDPSLATPATATFNGKANIQDITDPLNVISVDGGATLQVTMTDLGESGKTDKIAITLYNKAGGIWFSSNWSGTQTVEQILGGGNLVVH